MLVFIDLVAFMVRLNLNLLGGYDSDRLNKQTFKFVLYGTFAKREEVPGVDMIEGLLELTQKQNLGNFEFIVRYSSQGGPRWDEEFIERQVEIHHKASQDSGGIKKIWVCGPPVMNELFDRTLDRVAPKHGLNRDHHYEIL